MVTREELVEMLLTKGLAAERPGYGHATAEEVADAVIELIDYREFVEGGC